MNSRLRPLATTLMLALGLSLIIIMVLSDTDPNAKTKLLLSVGSNFGAALLGAALAMLIEQVMGTEVADIRNYLFSKEKFESAPDYLDVVSGSWHVYYMTKSKAATKWRYTLYDLRRGDVHNTLHGSYQVDTESLVTKGRHDRREYRIEAGLRGKALVAISRAVEGTERESIEIVPAITSTHLGTFVGVQLLETWDGDLALSHSIFSRQPLFAGDAMKPENHGLLNKLLEELLKTQKMNYLLTPPAL